MENKKYQFELVDKYPPFTVVQNALKEIETETRGYVVGKIASYTGHIQSYTKRTGLAASLEAFQGSQTVEVDIQDSLGAQSNVDNRFEVYLSVKGLQNYKYRMMFIDYGAISYPVTVVLNDTLARVYSNKYGDTFTIKSMKELENVLDKVIHSEPLTQIIQSLINEAIRRERASEYSENTETTASE